MNPGHALRPRQGLVHVSVLASLVLRLRQSLFEQQAVLVPRGHRASVASTACSVLFTTVLEPLGFSQYPLLGMVQATDIFPAVNTGRPSPASMHMRVILKVPDPSCSTIPRRVQAAQHVRIPWVRTVRNVQIGGF